MRIDARKHGSPTRESGQSQFVALACALPVILAALLLMLQICWVGYLTLSFDHALYQTSWAVDRETANKLSAASPSSANEAVKGIIASDWTQIDTAALSVSDAKCTIATNLAKSELGANQSDRDLRIERATQTFTVARITAKVALTVKPLVPVPGIDEVVLERRIDKTQRVSMRFEVS